MWPWLSTDCRARAGFSPRSIAAIPSALPPPPPGRACTGLARERESWWEPGGAYRAGRGRPQAVGGVGGDARGRWRLGTTLEPCRRRPGIPLQALEKGGLEKQFSNLPRPLQPFPMDLSLLLNDSPLEHTSPGVNSPRSVSPCLCHPLSPRLMGYLIIPQPYILYSW